MTQPMPAPPAPPPVPGLPSRTASLVLSLLTAGAAAVITLSPLLPWSTSVFGNDSASGLSWFDTEETDWLLGAIPDGVPMLLLGLALLAVAGMTVLLSLPGRTPPAGRSALAGLHIAATVLSALSFLWYVLSYGHFDSLYGGFADIGSGLVLGTLAAMGAGGASALGLLLTFTMKASQSAPNSPMPYGSTPYPATPGEATHG